MLCVQRSGEKGETSVERGGGLRPWNVCALSTLSVLLGRGATVRAQPATGLFVEGKKRQDNAVGAGGMMAVSEKEEQV